MGKLTDTKVKNIKTSAGDRWYNDGNGLYLRVRSTTKTWIIRRAVNGKTTVKTIGRYPAISLADARVEAAIHRPEAEKRAITVQDLARRYCRIYVDGTLKRPELFTGYLRRAIYPAIGSKQIGKVDTFELATMVEHYSANRSKRGADQLRSTLKKLFGYAREIGLIDRDPAAGLSRRITKYVYVPSERILDIAEIRQLWHSGHQEHTPVLQWMMVTGCRIGEATKALGHDIAGDIWTIPAENSKTGKPHWCHVPAIGLDVLKQVQHRPTPFGGTSSHPRARPQVVQRWLRLWLKDNGIEKFVPHDLRRSFATHCNELGIAPHVVEKMLNHTLDGVARIYNKSELRQERIDAAERWGKWLAGVVK